MPRRYKRDNYRYKEGPYKGEKVWMRVRTSHLCALFNCTPRTLRRWVRQGKVDPTSLRDIILKYNNRHLLDKRRKKNAPP